MDSEFKPGVRRELPDASVVPVIWPFRTTWMEHVAPDELEEWEEAMREHVGIPMNARPAAKPGCATRSGSPGGWDDCDYWGNGC